MKRELTNIYKIWITLCSFISGYTNSGYSNFNCVLKQLAEINAPANVLKLRICEQFYTRTKNEQYLNSTCCRLFRVTDLSVIKHQYLANNIRIWKWYENTSLSSKVIWKHCTFNSIKAVVSHDANFSSFFSSISATRGYTIKRDAISSISYDLFCRTCFSAIINQWLGFILEAIICSCHMITDW